MIHHLLCPWMSFPLRELSAPAPARSRALIWARANDAEGIRRRRALRRVDWELEKGNYKAALSLVKQLQGKPGGLRGFAAAQLASILAMENSVDTDSSEASSSALEDHQICIQHEAGHFLVGYLVGVLPYRYKVPSVEDLIQDKFAPGNVEFCGFDFLRKVGASTVSCKKLTKRKQMVEVNTNKVSSKALNRFLCVTLGGLVAEYLEFGYSELLHSDVEKLDKVLKWLYFREDDADLHLRWAALNSLVMLIGYGEARLRLAEAMSLGRSVGCCIDTIETTLDHLNR
ncbi:uncharacterized protein LOC116031943 isoform X2 [Ipomoea triloba]|uniref:uncharacterized protein LOC116031943 isoform X2 n=1 Tax=Ipomoea triloba TaxID=35885 RepID=UPI00125D4C36|nr:uncharacterized protein LOC116031943 isoform X2 [Ipomoea triloba]